MDFLYAIIFLVKQPCDGSISVILCDNSVEWLSLLTRPPDSRRRIREHHLSETEQTGHSWIMGL